MCVCSLCVNLLVSIGGLAQLVGHHTGGEVVEVQHVLEEVVLRHVILYEQKRNATTLMSISIICVKNSFMHRTYKDN